MKQCDLFKGYFSKHISTLRGLLDNVSCICADMSSWSQFDMLSALIQLLISRYVSWLFMVILSFPHQLMDSMEGLGHLEHNNEHVTYLQKRCHKIPHTQHNLSRKYRPPHLLFWLSLALTLHPLSLSIIVLSSILQVSSFFPIATLMSLCSHLLLFPLFFCHATYCFSARDTFSNTIFSANKNIILTNCKIPCIQYIGQCGVYYCLF